MAEGGPARRSGRWFAPLMAIAVGFAVLAALSIAVVVLPIGASETTPSSPSNTISAFSTAVNEHEWGKADSFLSARLRAGGDTTAIGFADKADVYLGKVVPVKQATNAAVLQVEFRFRDLKTSTSAVTSFDLDLVVEDGAWKIDTAFWKDY